MITLVAQVSSFHLSKKCLPAASRVVASPKKMSPATFFLVWGRARRRGPSTLRNSVVVVQISGPISVRHCPPAPGPPKNFRVTLADSTRPFARDFSSASRRYHSNAVRYIPQNNHGHVLQIRSPQLRSPIAIRLHRQSVDAHLGDDEKMEHDRGRSRPYQPQDCRNCRPDQPIDPP